MYIHVSGFTFAPRIEREDDGNVGIRAYHRGGGSMYMSMGIDEARSVRDQLAALELGDQPQQVAA